MSAEVPAVDVNAAPGVLARVKASADTVSSIVAAVTATAAFVGSVWVVLEAFNLPDGLPRLDASAFASLASAIAVAGVMFVAYFAVSVGAAGFAMRRWRTERLKSITPGFGETRNETVQFLALLAVTAGLGGWQALYHDIPVWVLLIAIALPPAVTVMAMRGNSTADPTTADPTTADPTTADPTTADPTSAKPTKTQRLTVLWGSALSTLVWFPSLFLLYVLVLGAHGFPYSPPMDIVVDAAFLFMAALINYLAAVANPTAGIALGLAITLIAAIINPQIILGAPFRAIKLVDVTVRFPQPALASDRDALTSLVKTCSPDIVVRFPSRPRTESYEVFVRQRIGQDWTVNCTRDGGTVTFPRTLITGSLPVIPPTPAPLQTPSPLPKGRT